MGVGAGANVRTIHIQVQAISKKKKKYLHNRQASLQSPPFKSSTRASFQPQTPNPKQLHSSLPNTQCSNQTGQIIACASTGHERTERTISAAFKHNMVDFHLDTFNSIYLQSTRDKGPNFSLPKTPVSILNEQTDILMGATF